MSLRVAVTGVDGCGKTTVIRALGERYRHEPTLVRAFRAPQYHEDADLPFAALSARIDELSVKGDLSGSVALKSVALFLSMTFYGDVERHVLAAYRPRLLVAERQCVLDTLAYAQFYLPKLLSAPRDPKASAQLASLLEATPGLVPWLKVVQEREPALKLDLDDFEAFFARLFSGEPVAIAARLLKLFNAELPDRVILLSTDGDTMLKRLAEKKSGAAPRELHEQAETLTGLLRSLRAGATLLAALKPSLRVDELDTSRLSIDETVDAVLALAEA